jgi:Arc/MetJ family transcription regulator
MTRSTVTLPGELLDELLREVKAKSKTAAVILAIRDEIRSRKKIRIKAMAGKMEFVGTADDLRHGDERLG